MIAAFSSIKLWQYYQIDLSSQLFLPPAVCLSASPSYLYLLSFFLDIISLSSSSSEKEGKWKREVKEQIVTVRLIQKQSISPDLLHAVMQEDCTTEEKEVGAIADGEARLRQQTINSMSSSLVSVFSSSIALSSLLQCFFLIQFNASCFFLKSSGSFFPQFCFLWSMTGVEDELRTGRWRFIESRTEKHDWSGVDCFSLSTMYRMPRRNRISIRMEGMKSNQSIVASFKNIIVSFDPIARFFTGLQELVIG